MWEFLDFSLKFTGRPEMVIFMFWFVKYGDRALNLDLSKTTYKMKHFVRYFFPFDSGVWS